MCESRKLTTMAWLIVIAASVLMLLLGGCGASNSVPPTPTPWPTPIVVQQTSYVVERGTVADFIYLDGRVSPVIWDPVYFKVDGKLVALNVTEGAKVRQGDIMAELDTKTLSEQLAQARLALEQAQNQAEQQESSTKYALERARTNLRLQELQLQKLRRTTGQSPSLQVAQAEAELERARVNLQRAQAAYNVVAARPDVGATSQAAALQTATIEYKLAETKYLQALSDLDIQVASQELQVYQARLNVQELEEKLAQTTLRDVDKARIQVESLERQIEERRLRAPYDGLVMGVGINLTGLTKGFSQRPKVGDNIPAYSALVVVAKPEPVEITVDGNQKRVTDLYIGQPVTVTHPAWTRPFTSEILALPVALSSTGIQPVGSQVVRIGLPAQAPPMSIGDPVNIIVEAEKHTNTLFLHPAAIRRFAGRTFVVVQDGERQQRIDVKLGLENSTQAEILSGLQAGDTVIGP